MSAPQTDPFVPMDEVQLLAAYLRDSDAPKRMLDVGALYGTTAKPFLELGWQVHAFEPEPSHRAELEKLAAQYPQLTIDPRAVSNEARSNVAFYSSEVSAGISGLHAFHESHVEAARVDVTTLMDYCSANSIDAVGLLKIDTEGNDLFVLKGFPWDRMCPFAVVCEFEDGKTKPLGYDYRAMAQFLVDRGYDLVISEWFPIERYGVQHRWRRFMRYPADLATENAWGNLLAVQGEFNWPKFCTCTTAYFAQRTHAAEQSLAHLRNDPILSRLLGARRFIRRFIG